MRNQLKLVKLEKLEKLEKLGKTVDWWIGGLEEVSLFLTRLMRTTFGKMTDRKRRRSAKKVKYEKSEKKEREIERAKKCQTALSTRCSRKRAFISEGKYCTIYYISTFTM